MKVVILTVLGLFLATAAAEAQQTVQIVGPTTINTNQVLVGTTSTLILPARNRNRVGVNVLAANNCAFGNTGVTLTNGYKLQPVAGATTTIESSAAIYGVCDVATTVSYMEVQ